MVTDAHAAQTRKLIEAKLVEMEHRTSIIQVKVGKVGACVPVQGVPTYGIMDTQIGTVSLCEEVQASVTSFQKDNTEVRDNKVMTQCTIDDSKAKLRTR